MWMTDGAHGAAAGNGHEKIHFRGARARKVSALVIGAVGVVYGDIGTSPIYALREAIRSVAGEAPPAESDVLGVLSIIVWSLTLVVSVKYALFVLRADNNGEGGTLSIMALARSKAGRFASATLWLGMAGAALFYGDALITPAISVLSAVEGVEVVAPSTSAFVVPATVAILIALFSVQRFGTAWVARVFGPIMAAWFLVLAVAGAANIAAYPRVFMALNPLEAATFLWEHGEIALLVMGAAFLAVTGAEALYADLGHFGRRPIVLAWFALVFPALLINYFGQSAYILADGGPVQQPLFQMVPGWTTLPMVILATMATVIASQATITGAYSLTRQAVQLQLLPRLTVMHTSAELSGQIYMPRVNWMLMIGSVWLVLEFDDSGSLAGAYGISVAGVMVVTAILLFVVIWRCWDWNPWLAALVVAPFLALDGLFLSANTLKIPQGGWVSITVAAVVMLVIVTWRRGSRLLFEKTRKNELPLDVLSQQLAAKPPTIVPGTAVFLTADPVNAPTSLMHSLKHYKVLHQSNVILSVVTEDRPRVPNSERVAMEVLNPLFMRVTLKFGFMEQPNIPRALAICRKMGWKFDIMRTSFFLSRRSLKAAEKSRMPAWQDRLFIALSQAASHPTEYFQIPTGRVVEIGMQVEV